MPEGGHLARVAAEFLRPVPVAELAVAVSVAKPGRGTQLIEASVSSGGREVLAIRAWWRRSAPGIVPDVPLRTSAPVPPPEELADATPESDLAKHLDRGYIAAMRWRYAEGAMERPGSAMVWGRPRIPLLEGEEPSGTQLAGLLADSSSGVSAAFDFRTHLFVNIDLVLSLLRPPQGPWLFLDARTAVDGGGGGITSTVMGDRSGAAGTVVQNLFVQPHQV